jgi:NAD(P)-dependent dehydrogenase (short-subunit alcohol dehydrogenase family)
MSEFENKVAVITGGGGGIGRAAAARLLEEGASVVLSGRRQEVLEAARRELDSAGERVAVVAGDVGSPAAAARVVEQALTRFGGVDVLVNSTGIFRVVPFLEQTEEQVEEALDSTLRPTFYTSQALARGLWTMAAAARS